MDTIGIIVTFCSIYPDQKEIRKGIENLKIGFNVKFGKNLDNYIIQLASLNKKLVINETFRDKEAKIIISAIGESSSSQALGFIDFNLIKNSLKTIT